MNNGKDSRLQRIALGILVLVLGAGIFLSVSLLQGANTFSSPTTKVRSAGPLLEENKAGAVEVGRSPLEPKGAPVNGTCEMAADAVPDPLSTIGTGRALPGGSAARDAPQTAGMHEGPAPSVSGGTGDVANFQDSADLVVRDGSGQVRQDRTVR